jgi:UDP-glucose 4-epimerase
MTALVTGGAGFIGSHLVERLLREGHKVVVVDNFSTGRERNLEAVKNHPRLKIYKIDIADFEAISKLMKNVKRVFHLAALSTLVSSIEKPLDYFRSNVLGTASVLEAARVGGIKRFIYAASSSCYGIPDQYPTKETAEIKTEYPYAETKYLGERLALHYSNVYQIPVVSLRLFNVYGRRVRSDSAYGAALGIFMSQKINNRPLTIVGDGEQKRDFVFVIDAVDAFIRAAQSTYGGEIFNVGSGNPQSVNSMVKLIASEKKAVYVPRRPGEPDQTWADVTKIKAMLGWRPTVSFKKGVRMVLAHAADWKNAPLWTKSTIEEATRNWFKYLSRK